MADKELCNIQDQRHIPPCTIGADHKSVNGHFLHSQTSQPIGSVETLDLANLGGKPFQTVLADPPWRFQNRTGKVATEHKRLNRYDTMTWKDIAALPVADLMAKEAHCYLWVPNTLLDEGLNVLEAWGFTYKSNLVWYKIRKDGGPDGRGVGFYFSNVTELVLFGVRGHMRILPPGRSQVNLLATRKREHSRKPDKIYPLIKSCSPRPFLELFARYPQPGWVVWENEASMWLTAGGLRTILRFSSMVDQEKKTT